MVCIKFAPAQNLVLWKSYVYEWKYKQESVVSVINIQILIHFTCKRIGHLLLW